MNYFKILLFLQKGDKGYFDVPVEEQKKFLNCLPEPRNDIERGYRQYQCQNYLIAKWKVMTFNFVAAAITPIIVICYLIKGLVRNRGEHYDAMIENKGMDEVIPKIIIDKYHPVSDGWYQRTSLSFSDIYFLFRIVRCAPHHPYFVLKSIVNIANYSDMIRLHTPNVMIQFGEFSYSSSILTAYCHQYEIRHIDIMHGEKFFFMRDSFFHYDECYVWSQHYVDLFMELRAEKTQFHIALPKSMNIDCAKYKNDKVYADCKYYLQEYTEEQIISIVCSMKILKNQGCSIKYRPHPRYSDLALLRKYVAEDDIEYAKEVNVLESISNLDTAVGSFTTVLAQAFFSGKKVIIDDVTFKDRYNKLREMKYILASGENLRLSQVCS